MKVRDAMTHSPVSVKRTHTLKHALHTIAEHDISGCPVTDSRNNVVGVVSQSDILNILDVHGKVHKTKDMLSFVLSAIKSEKFERLKAPLRRVLEKEVRHFMSADPVTVNADDDLYSAAKILSRHDIDRLVVVKNRRLVGVLTKSDLIKALDRMEG